MSEELLPCPFERTGRIHAIHLTSNGDENIFVECECGASGPPMASSPQAIAAWNARAPAVTSEAIERAAERISQRLPDCCEVFIRIGEDRPTWIVDQDQVKKILAEEILK